MSVLQDSVYRRHSEVLGMCLLSVPPALSVLTSSSLATLLASGLDDPCKLDVAWRC